jgi:transposase
MDQVHVIRHKVLVEGKSRRAVAQEMGVSRNTVRKYADEESEPRRKEAKRRTRPVFEGVRARMEELLAEWSTRTTAKQRITGTRLHRELRQEGYECGLSLVRQYLRERRLEKQEVFIPLVHRSGDEAQVDFFEVTVDVGGERRKVWKFVLRLMYSGRDFTWLYEHCDQLAFLDGHVRAFAHFGAVPHRCVYDNLSAAVKRLVLPQRELTARFAALQSHYLFEACFARPNTGHDKGGVESRGRGIRLQHLTPIPCGPTLTAIAEWLLGEIEHAAKTKPRHDGKSVMECFAQEQPRMLPLLRGDFEARMTLPVSVSSKSQVRINGALYSVPTGWARREITALVGVDEVTLVFRGEQVRQRKVGRGRQQTQYRHYLPELARKPQAVRQVAPELLSELGEPFGKLWRLLVDCHGPRDAARAFAQVLRAIVEHGEDEVRDGVARALAVDRSDLLWLSQLKSETPQEVEVPDALQHHDIEQASAADYDELLWEVRHE